MKACHLEWKRSEEFFCLKSVFRRSLISKCKSSRLIWVMLGHKGEIQFFKMVLLAIRRQIRDHPLCEALSFEFPVGLVLLLAFCDQGRSFGSQWPKIRSNGSLGSFSRVTSNM